MQKLAAARLKKKREFPLGRFRIPPLIYFKHTNLA
jgi:hypothetical protein